jgi:hypothetical protein
MNLAQTGPDVLDGDGVVMKGMKIDVGAARYQAASIFEDTAPHRSSRRGRTTPDPEALQRLMEKTEVDGGGGLNAKSNSEVVAKLPTAIHEPANKVQPELEPTPSVDEILPPPVPTLPTGRSRGRGTKEEPRVRAKDGERLRQTSIHLPVELHKRVRKYAFDQEVTLSTVMVDAIEAWLDAREG